LLPQERSSGHFTRSAGSQRVSLESRRQPGGAASRLAGQRPAAALAADNAQPVQRMRGRRDGLPRW